MLEKYGLAFRMLDLPGLDRKTTAVKAVDALLALRNSLTHYKMVTHDPGKESNEQKPAEFERQF
ncbi:hypothetical protein [Burkholderia pyrrocinia]